MAYKLADSDDIEADISQLREALQSWQDEKKTITDLLSQLGEQVNILATNPHLTAEQQAEIKEARESATELRAQLSQANLKITEMGQTLQTLQDQLKKSNENTPEEPPKRRATDNPAPPKKPSWI